MHDHLSDFFGTRRGLSRYFFMNTLSRLRLLNQLNLLLEQGQLSDENLGDFIPTIDPNVPSVERHKCYLDGVSQGLLIAGRLDDESVTKIILAIRQEV